MMVRGESLVHQKDNVFVLKTHFLKKMYYFLKTMLQSKMFFGLIQVPNTSKHIYRNKVATMKASRKTAHNKVFFSFW